VALLEKFRSQYHANIQYDLMLSALYYQAAAYTKAQTLYRKLLQKNPNNGLLWLGLAVSLEADMHRSDAVKAYQQAIKNNISENELRSFVVNKINVLTSGSDVVEDQAG
jgi:MSHA biogenesis protein MshN